MSAGCARSELIGPTYQFSCAAGFSVSAARGLEVGADDFLAKDVTPEVLVARIRKALERVRRLAFVDAPDTMTNTEAAIFRVLASEPGRFRSAQELYSSIRGEGYVGTEGNIRVHMSHLRSKLPPGYTLECIRGRGYALVRTT